MICKKCRYNMGATLSKDVLPGTRKVVRTCRRCGAVNTRYYGQRLRKIVDVGNNW